MGPGWHGAVKLPHPAEVVEGLRVDDLRQVLDDEAETLLLQLGGETPHLLGPLDLGEAAHQLLAAAQRGHGVAHGLNGRQLSAKSLLRGESTEGIQSPSFFTNNNNNNIIILFTRQYFWKRQ